MSDKERLIQIFEHAVNKAWGEGFDYIDLSTRDGKKILELLKEDEQFGNAEQFAKDNNVPTNWISVKDRLPNVDKSVIVFARGKNNPIYKIAIASMTNKNIFDIRLETELYWREPWEFFNTNYEITHWMPLPEPPKKESTV